MFFLTLCLESSQLYDGSVLLFYCSDGKMRCRKDMKLSKVTEAIGYCTLHLSLNQHTCTFNGTLQILWLEIKVLMIYLPQKGTSQQ